MIDPKELMSFILQGLGVSLAGLIVWIFNQLKDEIKTLNLSINELNLKMVVVVSTVGNHDDRISKLEEKEDTHGNEKGRGRGIKRSL